ncbi:class II aldolase/adducin family protein [Phycicoccus endophyticus]|uniref:Class II aldolase/adducin family protein n=1 Tax=Phycicoccus endophyticus TaxID=1690220 RepID=A0A7G9R5U5_9MICO|nr:class II aldolase/adducin family protein [Phycicoccus endophyticus]NHI20890.1 class II aldolase/adducin family protein [Phycicoccus endophyticus]QNN50970.1 class II aldolase/adducin family protein [Phycicoccus endophyticus]GGL22160.1 fuculose phosphate aldolase [Phycicoccus endophyticus]
MGRAEVLEQLLDAGRHVVARGLVQASGGNLSARLPGTDRFAVTATGTWLDRLEPADFAELTLGGEHVGGAARPSVEWQLHQRTYAVRPDVTAIVHLHPQHVLLVDLLGAPIRFTTLDHQYYLGSAGRVPFLPSGSAELADAAAEAAREHDAVVLAHHGCSALGDSVPMALRRALNLEEAAAMTYRLLLAGNTSADFPDEWRGRIIEA